MMSETTLAELFARDPFKLSDLELDRMIEHYREARKTFIQGGGKQAKAKPDTSLADLGLL